MNPFKLLNVNYNATTVEIIRAAAYAMRERKYSIQDIAAAQKALIDPLSNKVNRFINFLNTKNPAANIKVLPPEDVSVSSLEYDPVLKTKI